MRRLNAPDRGKLEARLDELTEAATRVIVESVTAYRAVDEGLLEDVKEHVHAHLAATLRSFGASEAIAREDLLFVRAHAARRVSRIPIAD